MPQGRIVLKSISESKKLANLKTDGARLLYTWLITHLDVNGNFSADPDVVNGKVFTRLKKTTKTVESYLDDLEGNKLIKRYNANGDIFLHVPDFVEKQPSLHPNKEGKPTIPRPTPDQLQTNSRVTLPQVKESKVKESKENRSNSYSENTTSTSANEIIEAWQKLPLPDDKKKISGQGILAIERALSVLACDPIEPIHDSMVLEAIGNYEKALKLPESQAYKHTLYNWLFKGHVRKYVSYAFDLDHHDGSKFKPDKKHPDIKAETERLRKEGRL